MKLRIGKLNHLTINAVLEGMICSYYEVDNHRAIKDNVAPH